MKRLTRRLLEESSCLTDLQHRHPPQHPSFSSRTDTSILWRIRRQVDRLNFFDLRARISDAMLWRLVLESLEVEEEEIFFTSTKRVESGVTSL